MNSPRTPQYSPLESSRIAQINVANAMLTKKRRELAAKPLGEFIACTTPRFSYPHHLQPLLDLFERIKRGEEVRAIVSVPPRHGKSETLFHGIAQLLLARPEMQL